METNKIACDQAAFTIVHENREEQTPLAVRVRFVSGSTFRRPPKQRYTPTGCFDPTATGVSQS
jgi:hypothetical protein